MDIILIAMKVNSDNTPYYILYMEPRFVILLAFSGGYVNIIKLTSEELAESEKYEEFEAFLHTLEDKYGLRMKDICWMSTETIHIYRYEIGELQ